MPRKLFGIKAALQETSYPRHDDLEDSEDDTNPWGNLVQHGLFHRASEDLYGENLAGGGDAEVDSSDERGDWLDKQITRDYRRGEEEARKATRERARKSKEGIFESYLKSANEDDKALVEGWNENLNILLTFVRLPIPPLFGALIEFRLIRLVCFLVSSLRLFSKLEST